MGSEMCIRDREQLRVAEQRRQRVVDLVLERVREQAARIADIVRQLAKLKSPRSVEYRSGARMIDLSSSTTHHE